MNRSLLSGIACASAGIATVVSLGACGGGSSSTASPPSSAKPASPIYSTKYFTTPVDVAVPSWLEATPTDDTAHFVTFGSSDGGRKLRILSPVVVYPPGSSTATPVPADYVSYLLGQTANGGHFTERVDTKVGGQPATVLTATTDQSLDGSMGCPETGISPADCFGLQPEVIARLAVITTDRGPLLIWLRNDVEKHPDMKAETQRFAQFLAGVHFSGRSPQAAPAPVSTALDGTHTAGGATASASPTTAFDGTYRMVITQQEWRRNDPEAHPENWGTYFFVFGRSRFAFTQENASACTWAYGRYLVTGQRVEWRFIDGGGIAPTHAQNKPGEDFVFGWSRHDDTMTLTAISPPEIFMNPWYRVSGTPSGAYLSKRCLPPARAMIW